MKLLAGMLVATIVTAQTWDAKGSDRAREESGAAIDLWAARLGTIRVSSPSGDFDALVNRWSLYQALACRMWARSAMYQSSGAFGFRDQLQDGMAFVYAEPSVTRAHLPSPDVVNKLSHNSVLGTVLATGLRAVIAEPRITEAGLRAAFESAGRAAVHRMERYLNTLGTIASAAPLLGLMGTVIGMIEIFGSQAPSGGNNPALLAHGISVALYNTAFGLMIAIPALMFYRYFRGLVDSYTLEMEQASDRLVPHLMRFAVPRSS